MTEVNGNGAIANPMLQLVEQLAAEIRAGRVSSLAIVAVAPTGGVFAPIVGNQFGDLFTGCAMIQDDIMKRIKAPPPSSIVRASAIPNIRLDG